LLVAVALISGMAIGIGLVIDKWLPNMEVMGQDRTGQEDRTEQDRKVNGHMQLKDNEMYAGKAQDKVPSPRRLDRFVGVAPVESALASTSCIAVSDNKTLDLSQKSCNGQRCPTCAIFPYEEGLNTVTLTLQNCSSALVSSTVQLGSSGSWANGLIDFTFTNLRSRPVTVVSDGAATFCSYAGREFTGNADDYENITQRCAGKLGGPAGNLSGKMSVAFTARWDEIPDNAYTTLFMFAEENALAPSPVNNYRLQAYPPTRAIYFGFKSPGGNRHAYTHAGYPVGDNFIHWGVTNRYLISFGSTTRLFRDGVLIGAGAGVDGAAIPPNVVRQLVIGHKHRGLVKDVWIFNSEVAWEDAVFESSHAVPAGRSAKAVCVSNGASGSTKTAGRLVFRESAP